MENDAFVCSDNMKLEYHETADVYSFDFSHSLSFFLYILLPKPEERRDTRHHHLPITNASKGFGFNCLSFVCFFLSFSLSFFVSNKKRSKPTPKESLTIGSRLTQPQILFQPPSQRMELLYVLLWTQMSSPFQLCW